mmetsp:Transcript_56413/g.117940  ORF Transcript_56413/g.117940 Transcript_56413/m.117940 type:complete len:115 (+) Transcript_56413:5137-5481(+)
MALCITRLECLKLMTATSDVRKHTGISWARDVEAQQYLYYFTSCGWSLVNTLCTSLTHRFNLDSTDLHLVISVLCVHEIVMHQQKQVFWWCDKMSALFLLQNATILSGYPGEFR